MRTFSRIYMSTTIFMMVPVLITCAVLNWQLHLVWNAISVVMVMAIPVLVVLHLLYELGKRVAFHLPAVWILLLASVPVSSFPPALFFADELPGDVWPLTFLGMAATYSGILLHAYSIQQLFQPENQKSAI